MASGNPNPKRIMLKPLPDNGLVQDRFRRRFADGSISLTLWFGEDEAILAVEIIFDLLLDEHAFRWIQGTKARYLAVETEERKTGRPDKQALVAENLPMPSSRLEDFDERSASLPPDWKDFIRGKLNELIGS